MSQFQFQNRIAKTTKNLATSAGRKAVSVTTYCSLCAVSMTNHKSDHFYFEKKNGQLALKSIESDLQDPFDQGVVPLGY